MVNCYIDDGFVVKFGLRFVIQERLIECLMMVVFIGVEEFFDQCRYLCVMVDCEMILEFEFGWMKKCVIIDMFVSGLVVEIIECLVL